MSMMYIFLALKPFITIIASLVILNLFPMYLEPAEYNAPNDMKLILFQSLHVYAWLQQAFEQLIPLNILFFYTPNSNNLANKLIISHQYMFILQMAHQWCHLVFIIIVRHRDIHSGHSFSFIKGYEIAIKPLHESLWRHYGPPKIFTWGAIIEPLPPL